MELYRTDPTYMYTVISKNLLLYPFQACDLCWDRGRNWSADFGYFRQCGTVFYLVRYGAVRCIHLVTPPNGQGMERMSETMSEQ